MRTITYDNSSQAPDTTARNITFVAWLNASDSAVATATVTVNGANDAPIITDGADVAGLAETDAALSTAGTMTVSDVDTDNVVTASVYQLVLGGTSNTSDPAAPSIVTLLNMLNVSPAFPAAILDNTENSDTLNWTFNSGAEAFDYLADGETLILNYTVRVTDSDGLTADSSVTITITGTNDNPTLTAGSIITSEDALEAGINVDAATSNLLTSATDIDDVDSSLVIGTVNGAAGSVDNPVSVTLSYTDADGAPQTQAVNLTVNANGSYSIVGFDLDNLPIGNNATASFNYQAADDSGALSLERTATITITGTNDNPALTAGNIITSEDALETGINVDAATSNLLNLATDIDDVNSSLVVGTVNGAAGSVDNPVSVTLSYTDADGAPQTQAVNLTVNANGSYSIVGFDLDELPLGNNATASFNYQAADDSGALSLERTATITITGTNDNPALTAGSISADEDALETGINVDATTSNLLNLATDIDDVNSSLVIGTVNGAAGSVDNPVSVTLSYTDADGAPQTQAVNLTVNADGSYSIVGFDLDNLLLGNNATASFNYQAADDSGALSLERTATITITGTNDNPALTAGNIITSEDALETGINVDAATSNLLNLATDIDDVNSSLVVGTVNGAAGSVDNPVSVTLSYTDADGAPQTQAVNLTVNANGSYSIVGFDLDELPLGNNATASFNYQAADDSGALSLERTATITITGTNDNPALTAGSISADEDALETGINVDATTSNLLNLATDIDDVNSSLVIGTVNGAAGSVDNPVSVTLSYTDADGAPQTQAVNLTVNADGSYSIVGFDLDNLPLGNNATASFNYQAADDSGALSLERTATITITGTNDNPALTAGNIITSEDALETGINVDAATSNLLNLATDIDDVNSSLVVGTVNGAAGSVDNPVSVTLSYTDADGAPQTQAVNLTVNANGSYSIVGFDLDELPLGNNATASFNYQAKDDSNALSTERTAIITITGTNDAAAVSSDSEVLVETNAALSSSGTLTSSDVDNPDNTFTPATINGTIGTFTIDAAGAWTFTANSAFDYLNVGTNVNETFNVTSVDNTASSVTIQIDGTSDAAIITVTPADTDVVEDDVPNTATGTVSVTDVDAGEGSLTSSTANYGTVVVDGSGNWTYTLDDTNPIVDALMAGEPLIDTITFTSDDGTTQTQTITITGANDAPTATNLSAAETYIEDTALILAGIVVTDVDSANVTVTLTLSDITAGLIEYANIHLRSLSQRCGAQHRVR